MNRRRLLISAAALCLGLTVPAGAQADGYHGYDQQEGLAKCFWSVKKVQKLKDVARNGIKVTGQCDRDTQVSTTMSFKFETKPDNDWADIHSGGIPPIGKSERPFVRAGVPFSFHTRLRAAKFASRYPKVQIHMMFYRRGTEKPDRFPSLDRGQYFTVAR